VSINSDFSPARQSIQIPPGVWIWKNRWHRVTVAAGSAGTSISALRLAVS
jgi:hypothetical protein